MRIPALVAVINNNGKIVGNEVVIINKYSRAVDGPPVPLSSTGGPSTAESGSEVPAKAKIRQRRSTVLEIECVA